MSAQIKQEIEQALTRGDDQIDFEAPADEQATPLNQPVVNKASFAEEAY